MKLIVGLGNPDLKYKNTRHNIGFMVLDSFAKKNGYKWRMQTNFRGETYIDKNFILLKPQTYMNASGDAVSLVSNYYHIDSKDIMVISDDFNLDFLKLRLREKGSAGGHNGLKSIIQSLGTEEFNRLRIGLGAPGDDSIDFVLGKLSKDDKKQIESLYPKTDEIIQEFIDNKPYDYIMNHFNTNESI